MIHEKFNGMHGALNYYRELPIAEFPTLVFLNGLDSGSDYYALKSIANHIQGPFGKIFIDLLGRGESAETTAPRTNENISAELHEFIEQVIDEPVIFFVHSMSGVYVADFIQRYGELVYGVIAVEPTTSVFAEYANEPAYQAATQQFDNMTDTERADAFRDHELTTDEIELAGKLERSVTEGTTIQAEMQQADENIAAIRNQNIPDGVPVLLFTEPFRLTEYQNSEYANGNTKYVELEGNHYLHYAHPTEMGLQINEWMAMSLLSGGQPSV